MKHHQFACQFGRPLRVRQAVFTRAGVRIAAVYDNHLDRIAGRDDCAVVFHRGRSEQIRRESTRRHTRARTIDHGHIWSAAPLQTADDATGLETSRTGDRTIFNNGK